MKMTHFYLLTALNLLILQELKSQCDSTFLFKGTNQGHAYFFSTEILSWDDANDIAKALGGYLVVITSLNENNFVANQVTGGQLAWIGLSDAAVEGQYVWPNGESFTYVNWGAGEPNNAGTENWVEINRNAIGKWNDMPAGFPRRFVVEFDSGDTDQDGQPDVCDSCPLDALNDQDGDGLCADQDNCPAIANADQADTDNDGEGDACDQDIDNDGCLDQNDTNPLVFSSDSDCDGIADDCDYCAGGDDKGPCSATVFPGFGQVPEAWRCGNNKVLVCQNGATRCISPNTMQTQLKAGDFLGPCISCALMDSFQFEVFPNPASRFVTVYFSGDRISGATLQFFDNLGRPVLQHILSSELPYGTVIFDLEDLAPGPYFVQASNSTLAVTKKLVLVK